MHSRVTVSWCDCLFLPSQTPRLPAPTARRSPLPPQTPTLQPQPAEEDLDEEEDQFVAAETYANYRPAKCECPGEEGVEVVVFFFLFLMIFPAMCSTLQWGLASRILTQLWSQGVCLSLIVTLPYPAPLYLCLLWPSLSLLRLLYLSSRQFPV